MFPYTEENGGPKGPARTTDQVIQQAEQVIAEQKNGKKTSHCQGVKGASWLMILPGFDLVQGMAIDYMHGILLGVQRLLLRLWFSHILKGQVFSVHNKADDVNKRLQAITPTLDITRMPTEVKDLKHWKAKEYRDFLLFYGPAVLSDTLQPVYFAHFMQLVFGIHTLLKSSVTQHEILMAEQALQTYVQHFSGLYDVKYMTLNVHQLLHLADEVRNLGPLHSFSCFSFEDKNGFVLKMIRGSRHVDSQVLNAITMAQKLPELQQTCIVPNTPEGLFCKEMQSLDPVRKGEKIEDGCYLAVLN